MNLNTVTFISTLAALVLVLVVNNLIASAKYSLFFSDYFALSYFDWQSVIIILVFLGIPFSYFVTKSLAPFFDSQPIYLVTFHLIAIAFSALILYLTTLVPLTISVFIFFQIGLLYVSYLGFFLLLSSFFGCLVYMVLHG